MFNPSRDQARQMFFETWRKYRQQEPLTGIETLVLEVLLQHPEYHAQLDQPETFLTRDYSPEAGDINPFLHLSMHLALHEQLSIDQPPGITQRYQALLTRHQDAHAAQHAMMDCLGEMIWRAQRDQSPYDPTIYFDCLDRAARQ